MKHLITHKIGFSILLTLVLAFSVPGIADALTLHYASNSGDLETVARDQEFTIKVSVKDLKSPVAENPRTSKAQSTDIEYASGARSRPADPDPPTANYSVIEDANYQPGDTHYYTVTTTTTVTNTNVTPNKDYTKTINTRNWLTESAAYDYNDESISITSSPTLTLMRGNTAVTSLKERHEESDQRLSSSSSITLTGSSGTAGEYTITITDNTEADDFPNDTAPSTRASIKFTVFVVKDRADTPETPGP